MSACPSENVRGHVVLVEHNLVLSEVAVGEGVLLAVALPLRQGVVKEEAVGVRLPDLSPAAGVGLGACSFSERVRRDVSPCTRVCVCVCACVPVCVTCVRDCGCVYVSLWGE